MRKKVNPQLLASCLADIENGRSSVEECVSSHPDVAEDLLSLLEIARAIAPLPTVAPDPAFRARARMSLLAAISAQEKENVVTRPSLRRFWEQIVAGWGQPGQILTARMTMPAVIIILVIALTTAAGGGAVYASQDSLPGDALYQVKTTLEGLQLTLAAGDEAKAQTYLDLAARRLSEAQTAVQSGNTTATTAAVQAFTQDVGQADQHLAQAATSGKDVSELAAQLAQNLARHQSKLDAIKERAPDAAKPALAAAGVAAQKGLETASARVQSRNAGRSEATPTPSGTGSLAAGKTATPTVVTGTATPGVTTTLSSTLLVTFTQTVSDVQKLASDPNVPGQSYNGLLAKLKSAQSALDRGQEQVAARILDAFLHELNAMRQSGHISTENYDPLYAKYKVLVIGLGGTPEPAATPLRLTPRSGRAVGAPEGATDATETPENNAGRPGRGPWPPTRGLDSNAAPVPTASPWSAVPTPLVEPTPQRGKK